MHHSIRAAFFAGLAVWIALGCGGTSGSRKVTVKGKLLEGANPFILDTAMLKLPPGTSLPPGTNPIQITFIPAEAGESAPATVDAATGTFSVSLVPGKYKVAITASAGMASPDFFGGKYSSDKTQIRRDVKEGDEIAIDITKPQG